MGTLLIFKRCVYLLPVLFVNINSESLYREYYLESDKLCSLGFQPKLVEIGKDAESAAIVEEIRYFDTFSGKFPFICQFKVKSTQEMGIFAVIQKMKLRKNKTTGECIDYVQFRHSSAFQIGFLSVNLEKDDTDWGVKHCGNVNAMELDVNELDPTVPSQTLPYAFIDRKGKIDVRIYIANETVTRGTPLDLKIVFTAFHICQQDMVGSRYKKCGAETCIWHKYFNDKILNCPFTSCADENGCQIYYEAGIRPSAGLATKVMVGIVAGVFTMFVVFVVFLWLFRHCSLCWNDSAPGAQNTTQMRPVPTMEDVQPTAPPGSPSIDKDLPPTYESLFPNA